MAEPRCFQVEKLSRKEIRSIVSLSEGVADAYTQRLALKVIVNNFCRTHDVLFIPGESDQTAFLNGRAFPGMQILKMINVPIGQLTDEKEEPTHG